ncbi:hypothetical protein HGF60_11420 [Alteromonadaceae bacterium A_SAG2]|nr:hypothetical protein [Alteromonadaceae bacterium A_SAG2]
MDVTRITGFHTCKNENGYDYVLKNIPFLSGNGKNQWLTQGYYFWTDSDFWAKRWGKEGERVIGKFAINLCLKTEVLDLVGNVSHQLEFRTFAKSIEKKLTGKDDISVNQVIEWLRKRPGIFPYKAIKAQDECGNENIKFVGGRRETLKYLSRQQLCVFKENRDRIELCGFIEPHCYSKEMPA